MKVSIVLLAAVASLASAQLDKFPPCGLECLMGAVANSGCSVTDFKCNCESQQMVDESTMCVLEKCASQEDQLTSNDAAHELCAGVGVDINPPINSATITRPGSNPEPTAAPEEPAPTAEEPAPTAEVPEPSAEVPAESSAAAPMPSAGHGGHEEEAPAPASNASSGSLTPIATQAPGSAAGRTTATLGLVGLGVIAALAL